MTDMVRRPTSITLEQTQEWAEWAHKVEREIQGAIGRGQVAYWQMAEALYRFEEAHSERDEEGEVKVRGRGWKALLGADATLNDWLSQSHINLKRTTYYQAIAAWKELVVYRQLDPGTVVQLVPGKVEVVLPSIKAGSVTTQEAVDDASQLGFQDLRDKYYGERTEARDDQDDPDAQEDVPNPGQQDEGTEAVTAADIAEVYDVPLEMVGGEVVDDDGNLATTGSITSGHLSAVVAQKLADHDEPLSPTQEQVLTAILSRSNGLAAPEPSTPTLPVEGPETPSLAVLMGMANDVLTAWEKVSKARIPKELNSRLETLATWFAGE